MSEAEIDRNAMPNDVAVLIPFHHRRDLLWPLVEGLSDLPVLIVDDGPEPTELPSTAATLRSTGECGFSVAVNLGLEHLQDQGFKWVLVLNDDARIGPRQLATLCASRADDIGVIAPVICQDDQRYGGVRVRWWGRVLALEAPARLTEVDAVWGCCMLIPSWARFSEAFSHGFEDIELCIRLGKRGLRTVVVPSVECQHVGAASLERSSAEHRQHSVYGHLQLYNSRLLAPLILVLACLHIFREKQGMAHYLAAFMGFRDWVQRLD